MKKFKFTFWNGQVVYSKGYDHLHALYRAGLSAYNAVAYEWEEVPDANIPTRT